MSLTLLFCIFITFSAVQQPPLKPSHLICGRYTLQVGLDMDGFISSGFNPFSSNLAALNCSVVRVSGDVVWYEMDAEEGACGTTLRVKT